MARKPAPIQVTMIGYPNTTGMSTIDYRITDAIADPLDTPQKYTEKLVRLPCFLCYTPSSESLPICPTPYDTNHYVTYGSFNNLAKITDEVLQIWAKILRAVPNSNLLLKCKPFVNQKSRDKVRVWQSYCSHDNLLIISNSLPRF
jgi:protein O-GlcNAc transferase